MIKIGPSEGNSLAVIRWGGYLDKGIWLSPIKLWKKTRFMRGYWDFGLFIIRWTY